MDFLRLLIELGVEKARIDQTLIALTAWPANREGREAQPRLDGSGGERAAGRRPTCALESVADPALIPFRMRASQQIVELV